MMPKSKTPLTPKQERFVQEYLVDLNATQAAIRAGYSARTAEVIGYQLLQKTSVSRAIRKAQGILAKRAERTNDDILAELDNLTKGSAADLFDTSGESYVLKPANRVTKAALRRIASIKVKKVPVKVKGGKRRLVEIVEFKFYDKIAALRLSGQHRGLFVEKRELTGADGGPIKFIEVAKPDDPATGSSPAKSDAPL